MPTPHEDHAATQPWMTEEHRAWLVARKEADGTPYCFDCHDWHYPDEDHSMFPFGT
jgi:hypothetical protein